MTETFTNFAKTTLPSSLSAGLLEFTLTDGTNFPTADFYITISETEVIHIATRTGNDVVADERGAQGSTAVVHEQYAEVLHGPLAHHHESFLQTVTDVAGKVSKTPSSSQVIQPTGAAYTPLTLKGAFEQAAALFSIEDSDGLSLLSVSSTGQLDLTTIGGINDGPLNIRTDTAPTAGDSGDININTGYAQTGGSSGSINIDVYPSTSSAGSIVLSAGISTAGNGGSIAILPGSGAITDGAIYLDHSKAGRGVGIGHSQIGAALDVEAFSASSVVQIIRGFSGQTGDLLRFVDYSGPTLAKFLAGGQLAFGTTPATTGYVRLPNNSAIVWRNAANGANVNGIYLDASDGVVLAGGRATFYTAGAYMDLNGVVRVYNTAGIPSANTKMMVGGGTNTLGNTLMAASSATAIPLVISAAAAQTAHMTRWTNSSDVTTTYVNSIGDIYVAHTGNNKISCVSSNSGTASIALGTGSLFTDPVNGRWVFTVGGIVSKMTIGAAAADAALRVIGHSSQSGNMLSLATNVGTVLAGVTADGKGFFGTTTPDVGFSFTPPALTAIQPGVGLAFIAISKSASGTGAGAGIVGVSDDGEAMASGDRLGYFLLGGAYNTSHAYNASAGMTGWASEAFGAAARGSELRFETTANGATGRTIRIKIPNNLDGFEFGSAFDTNLYRSAANTLKTDDALDVAGRIHSAIGLTTMVVAHGSTGATETIDLSAGDTHTATLDVSCVFTFSNAAASAVNSFTLILTQGSGGQLATWPGSVMFDGGVDPTLSTGSAEVDILTFVTPDGGTTWYGFIAGQAMS